MPIQIEIVHDYRTYATIREIEAHRTSEILFQGEYVKGKIWKQKTNVRYREIYKLVEYIRELHENIQNFEGLRFWYIQIGRTKNRVYFRCPSGSVVYKGRYVGEDKKLLKHDAVFYRRILETLQNPWHEYIGAERRALLSHC